MQRLPILLIAIGLTLASLYLWQARPVTAKPHTLALSLRVLDADGYPLAGAEVVQLHELRREVVGVSDTFGSWHGQLAVRHSKLLELQINKQSAGVLLQASRTYPTGKEPQQDVVHLQATPASASRHPQEGYVRLEVVDPYLRQALLDWCQRTRQPVASHGARVLTVHDAEDGQLQVSLATAARDLFSFRVTYRVMHSRATVQKILRGIYAHTTRAYTAWHEEENERWYVYNPAGFWHLPTDAVLVNDQGQHFYPHQHQPRVQQQLELDTPSGESVCSQRECVVYSAHARQDIY